MKKWLCMLLALCLLLAGCQEEAPEEVPEEKEPVVEETPTEVAPEPIPEPEPAGYRFTRETFPVLDGSTSTAPLGQAMAAVLLGEDLDAVEDLAQFHKTTESYRRLIYGQADLIIAAEPAESIWEEQKASLVPWSMEPFALDGLIFVVNADNPVDSLSVEQIQKLYTGEITNWKEVGGADEPVAAFQRNAEAGSQTLMKKLVMDGLELAEPPKEQVVETMYGLMEAVRGFDGSAGAIGYSVYYYANDMRMAQGLKILKVDGVDPSPEAFRDGSYPFTNPYYVLRRDNEGVTEQTRILYDWLLSAEGQRLVAAMGYAPVDPEGKPCQPVWADWSRLPKQEPQGELITRRSPDRVEELTPADDYGILVPYIGEELQVGAEYGEYGWSHYRYGLADSEGRVVVDAVYDGVRLATASDVENTTMPVYILTQGDADEGEYGAVLYGLAALDGSWCTGMDYMLAAAIGEDEFALIDRDGAAWLCDLEGHMKPCGFDRPLVDDDYGDYWTEMGMHVCAPLAELWFGGDHRLVNFHTGQIITPPVDLGYCISWQYAGGDLMPASSQQGLYGFLDGSGHWALPPVYIDAYGFLGDYAQVVLDGRNCLINRQGRVALQSTGALNRFEIGGAFCYVDVDFVDGTILAVYDASLTPVDIPAIGCVWLEGGRGLSWEKDGQRWNWNGETVRALPGRLLPGADYGSLQALYDEDYRNGLYDYEAEDWVLPLEEGDIYQFSDSVTGEVYWGRTDYTYAAIYDCDGHFLLDSHYRDQCFDGLFPVRSGSWSGIMDENGQWLLRIAVGGE